MFAQIYTGCKCRDGETWRVGIHTEIDTDNDESYEIRYCLICMGDNLTAKTQDGFPCYHALDHDEIMAEIEFNDDE